MTTAWNNFTDDELARRSLAGSSACYEELVRRHQAPLMRFLTKRFPSRRDAEDILQEAFLKAWQSLHLYDPAYEFRSWLYTIAYRLAVSRGRRTTEAPLPAAEPASAAAPPEQPVDAQDERQSLWRCAREVLSEEQYLILWLHYVDEVPAGDIARLLNRSWVSVKTLMHRARKKLLPHLDGAASASQSDRPAATSAAVVEAGES